jgi:hypothetical protein
MPLTYERITYTDPDRGRNHTVILQAPAEVAIAGIPFLAGDEVDREGNLAEPDAAFLHRHGAETGSVRRVIEVALITRRQPMAMNLTYGELYPVPRWTKRAAWETCVTLGVPAVKGMPYDRAQRQFSLATLVHWAEQAQQEAAAGRATGQMTPPADAAIRAAQPEFPEPVPLAAPGTAAKGAQRRPTDRGILPLHSKAPGA